MDFFLMQTKTYIEIHFLERREFFFIRGTCLDGREMTNDENYCLMVHPVRMTLVGTSSLDKLSDFKIYINKQALRGKTLSIFLLEVLYEANKQPYV